MGNIGSICNSERSVFEGSSGKLLEDGLIYNKSDRYLFYFVTSQVQKKGNVMLSQTKTSTSKAGGDVTNSSSSPVLKIGASMSGEDKFTYSGEVSYQNNVTIISLPPDTGSQVGLKRLKEDQYILSIWFFNNEDQQRFYISNNIIKHETQMRFVVMDYFKCFPLNQKGYEFYLNLIHTHWQQSKSQQFLLKYAQQKQNRKSSYHQGSRIKQSIESQKNSKQPLPQKKIQQEQCQEDKTLNRQSKGNDEPQQTKRNSLKIQEKSRDDSRLA